MESIVSKVVDTYVSLNFFSSENLYRRATVSHSFSCYLILNAQSDISVR